MFMQIKLRFTTNQLINSGAQIANNQSPQFRFTQLYQIQPMYLVSAAFCHPHHEQLAAQNISLYCPPISQSPRLQYEQKSSSPVARMNQSPNLTLRRHKKQQEMMFHAVERDRNISISTSTAFFDSRTVPSSSSPIKPNKSPPSSLSMSTTQGFTPFDDDMQYLIKSSITSRKSSAPSFLESLPTVNKRTPALVDDSNKSANEWHNDSSITKASQSVSSSPISWKQFRNECVVSPLPSPFRLTRIDYQPVQEIPNNEEEKKFKVRPVRRIVVSSFLTCEGTQKQQHYVTRLKPRQIKQQPSKSSEQNKILSPDIQQQQQQQQTECNKASEISLERPKKDNEIGLIGGSFQDTKLQSHTNKDKHAHQHNTSKMDFSQYMESLSKNSINLGKNWSARMNNSRSKRRSDLARFTQQQTHQDVDPYIWNERAAFSLGKSKQVDHIHSPSPVFRIFGADLNSKIHRIYIDEKPTLDGKRKGISLSGVQVDTNSSK